MGKSDSGSIRSFVILTYLLFWLLFLVTGLTVFLKAPELLQTIMKNVCAWTSTFVLLILFRKLYPGTSFRAFLKNRFPAVGRTDFIIPMLIQAGIVVCSVAALTLLNGEPLSGIRFIRAADILPLLVINITSGPMGEELGWRAYALNELQKKFSPLRASLTIGVLWGFWHFPLWLVSGLGGTDLLLYMASFMVGILSFSVFLTYFYNKSGNILVAVWIHFLFNLLMQIALVDGNRLITVVAVLYFVASAVIVLLKKDRMLRKGPVQV